MRGAVEQAGEGRAVLGAGEAVRADAGVGVQLQVGVFGGLPGEVPPDEVVAVPQDHGGHRAAGQVGALGAAVDDVPAAGQGRVGLQEQAADLRGEDGGRYVGGERGDGVQIGEPEQEGASVDDEVHEVAVDLEVAVGVDSAGARRRGQTEGRVLGSHAVSIPSAGPLGARRRAFG
ncbi:hypothetical protein GCM10010391_71700 [Streptomyces anthocyanicus]|nr:hypothetical protein GCM10010391_71700 [Streptomyces anthocyanicus]